MLKGIRLVLTALIALFNGGIVYLLALGITGSVYWGLAVTALVIGGLFWLGRSEFGEKYQRAVFRMRPLIGNEKTVVMAAWREVCRRAGVNAEDYELFMVPAPEGVLNAMALGRKTVAVTPAMLTVPQQELEAVLAHELAHLLNKDSEYLLFVYIVNAVGSVAVWVLTGLVVFYGLITSAFSSLSGSEEGRIVGGIGFFFALFGWLLKLCAWVCTKLLEMAYRGLGRQEEYRSDAFAVKLGFGLGLADFLYRIWPQEAHRDASPAVMLFASHPPTGERLKRVLEALPREEAMERA